MELNQFLSNAMGQAFGRKVLHTNEDRYRDLFENASDIVFTLDSSGDFTSMNGAGERAGGYPREELIGTNFASFVAPEYIEDAGTVMACRQMALHPRVKWRSSQRMAAEYVSG